MKNQANTFIRTTNWDLYRVTGTIVDPERLSINYWSRYTGRNDRFAVVTYDPVRHHLTPSARIPLEGKPYVVTVCTRAQWSNGFHIRSTRRFKTLAAALKFMTEWANSEGAEAAQ